MAHLLVFLFFLVDLANVQAQVEKAKAALKHCHSRLEVLSRRALVRKSFEKKEDEKSESLRRWCLGVCSSVLIPTLAEQGLKSRPSLDGLMSAPMLSTIKESEALGISGLPDVASVVNGFGCISWSFRAMSFLARKPTVAEAKSLVLQSSSLELPDEKSVRMMKSMVQRANVWQLKASRTLAPKPGESKPCCVDTLKELVSAAGTIPLVLPGKTRLVSAIDDNGTRYCVCGGPNDGEFMLGCDKCERWFHGRCVNVCKDHSDTLQNWVCPPCSGVAPAARDSLPFLQGEQDDGLSDSSDFESDDGVASHAPDPSKLWPPYGLLNSPESLEALGKECFDCVQRGFETIDAGCTSDISFGTTRKLEETNHTTAVQDKGNGIIAPGENAPLVVSPELPATDVGVLEERARGEASKDATSLKGGDHSGSNGNVEADLAGSQDHTAINGSYVKSNGLHQHDQVEKMEALLGTNGTVSGEGLTVPTETGVVTETSVGSVEESDHATQNADERNPIAVSKVSIQHDAMKIGDSSAPPIAARLVCSAALPGAYLGAVIHQQDAANRVMDANQSPGADQEHGKFDPSSGDLATVNPGFVSAVGSGAVVPMECVQENAASVP